MQFGFGTGPSVNWMREELTELGVKELLTPGDVDAAMDELDDDTAAVGVVDTTRTNPLIPPPPLR